MDLWCFGSQGPCKSMIWYIWRKYTVSVGSSVGVCWSFSSWQVRDREQVLASPGSASLVTPAVEAGASTQTHNIFSVNSVIASWEESQFAQWTRMMIPRAAPGCWRLRSECWQLWEGWGWHKSSTLQNVQHTAWLCSGTVTKVQHPTFKAVCVFLPPDCSVSPAWAVPCVMLSYVDSVYAWRRASASVGGRWGEGLAAGDAELATGDNGHHTLGCQWGDKLVD